MIKRLNLYKQIKGKLLLSFIVLVCLFLSSSIITGYIIYTNQNIVAKFSEVIDPSIREIKDFRFLIYECKMLSYNILNSANDTESRTKLHDNIEIKYPELRKKLKILAADWDNPRDKLYLDTVLSYTDELMVSEKEFSQMIDTPEKFNDEMNIFQAKDIFNNLIITETDMVMDSFEKLSINKSKEKEQYVDKMVANSQNIFTMLFIVSVIVIATGIFLSVYMTRLIINPLNELKTAMSQLGKGKLTAIKQLNREDEIGDMANSLAKLVDGLSATVNFATEVGKGNYDSQFEPLSNEDALGYSIIEMRDNLKQAAVKDKQRNWAATGLAEFAEILRDNTTDIVEMTDKVLHKLVKYTNSNQGAIYILTDTTPRMIEMKACYAYNRKKYLEIALNEDEGLVGQAISERDKIYITDVPEDYLKITSGLGEASPSCILIVPIVKQEQAIGAIELATFEPYQDFEIEFIEKVAESLASAISNVIYNERSKKLLEESQMYSEQIKSQEEEMRQNMEELMAAQEEMKRKEQQLLKIIEQSQAKGEVLKDMHSEKYFYNS